MPRDEEPTYPGGAGARPRDDLEPGHTYPELPERPSLGAYREAAAHCRACDLWKTGTQTVFGEGKREARVVFVAGAIVASAIGGGALTWLGFRLSSRSPRPPP